MVTVSKLELVTFLFHLAGKIGFFINEVAFANGSSILREDIGEDATALRCTTDSTTCCLETRSGEFYFPDGTPLLNCASRGYYRSRGSQYVELNRQSTGTIVGMFRCEIPTANGTLVNLYINIGNFIM